MIKAIIKQIQTEFQKETERKHVAPFCGQRKRNNHKKLLDM